MSDEAVDTLFAAMERGNKIVSAKLAAAEDMAAALAWLFQGPEAHFEACPADVDLEGTEEAGPCECGYEALAAWRAAQGVVESGRDGSEEAR